MVVLKVTRQGDHLLMQENDSAPGELYPQAELSFFSKTSDDVVVFELDAGGRARKLTVQTGGRSIPVDRVP
jgi:hypothetical protein